jgi:hypothetical protein
MRFALPLSCLCALLTGATFAADIVWPQNRAAFYADESIELAVAALPAGDSCTVTLVPAEPNLRPITIQAKGDGTSLLFVLPPYALAPSKYAVQLDGKTVGNLTVSAGIQQSTMLVSQTGGPLREGGANFFLGNAFSFGLLTPDGKAPLLDLRNRRSVGLTGFETAIEKDLPTIVYMYWTGYVVHKPFGSEKSWANAEMGDAMRLLSFHTAQRLRRYRRNIVSVGTIDEPGLSWGKTPAGGMTSGFPNWDEKDWYESRGWKFTSDIAAGSDADWRKYMTIRCGIMKERMKEAADDLKTVWPDMVFSTDLYAAHAIMDGTDPISQAVNDVPSSHVFADWGYGRAGAYSGIAIERAGDPIRPLAHAMNGQLEHKIVPQPNQRDAYRVCMNAMLMAGIASNWWLNTQGMTADDLKSINEPAARLGALLREYRPADRDVAVLWSFSEMIGRQKALAAEEAHNKTGTPIKQMIANLPEDSEIKDGKVEVNAYRIGGNYRDNILAAHMALSRAGYPAHVVDERIVARGALKDYKVLVVLGQTFAMPPEVTQALADFRAKGGKIIVDKATKIDLGETLVTDADFVDLAFRWGAVYDMKPRPGLSERKASSYVTNWFMDEPQRKAIAPLVKTLAKTTARRVGISDSPDLMFERHVAGEGQVILVLNAHDKLPPGPETEPHWIYNYAPLKAKYTLPGIPEEASVYAIEGIDGWQRRRLEKGTSTFEEQFAPGEMKAYLVMPKEKTNSWGGAASTGVNVISTGFQTDSKMPVPLHVELIGPGHRRLFEMHRATNKDGKYHAAIPIGSNVPRGDYRLHVTEEISGHVHTTGFEFPLEAIELKPEKEKVRVFDEEPMRKFLAAKPEVVVVAPALHQAAADKLVAGLKKAGLSVTTKAPGDVLRKVAYPRVWNPFVKVHEPTKAAIKEPGPVEHRVTVTAPADGVLVVDDKGKPAELRQPKTLVTVGDGGWLDWSGDQEIAYESGCLLYVGADNAIVPLNAGSREEKTTPEFRAKWARPWRTLTTHLGAYQLPAQLPEAWTTDSHLILLGDGSTNEVIAILQASEILPRIVDAKYPGPGKALVQFAWSPFRVGKNAIVVGGSDAAGVAAGVDRLLVIR